jgi:hypothetical protein
MAHDATKVKMGVPLMSGRVVTDHAGDPATWVAGIALRQKSDGTLSVTKADGSFLGVSAGASLSNHKKTSIIRKGLKVPIRMNDQFARGTITITSYANLIDDTDDTITIGATTFTFQSGAVTPGQATAQAATGNTETAASLAAQINAHATASTVVVATASGANVYLKAIAEGDDGEEIVLTYDDVDGTGDSVGLTVSGEGTLIAGGTDWDVVKGALVYIDDATGYAADPAAQGVTVTNAIYAEDGSFTGIDESGAEVVCALIDMIGGL